LGLKNKQLLRTLRHNGTITKVNWAPDEKFMHANLEKRITISLLVVMKFIFGILRLLDC
jgi:hypothetical protein